MRSIAITVLVLLMTGADMAAQDATFTATVQPARVAAGEQFTVSFVLSGSSLPKHQNFKPPEFGQFVVLSGPNSSTSVQYVNGRMSSTVTLSYYLYARHPGKYSLGEATIEVGGTQLRSQPVTVEVVAAGKQPGTQTAQSVPQEISENLYIQAIPDKKRVKQGEQFVITYKLFTRVNIENYIISKSPTYEGFWAEDLEQPKSPEVTTEIIDGKQFRVAVLKRTALFATQAGKLAVSPLEVRCAVRVQGQRRPNDPFDIFNDPFLNPFRTQEVDIASNALTMTVDRLPGSPPAEFTGAIGTYTLTASVNRREGKTGEPLSMTLTVSGTGNIRLVSVPRPDFPADFEVYEPKLTEEISREGGVIRGKKTAEYLVIPRNAGDRVIEPFVFTFFDLQKNSYVTLRTQRFPLTILPGKELASGGTAAVSREEIRLLGEDIRYLKLSPGSLRPAGEASLSGDWVVVGLLLPPLIFIGSLFYRRRQEELMGNRSLVRSRKAGREASRRLKAARKILVQGTAEKYHAEIARAVSGYLGDKLAIPVAGLTMETAVAGLRERGVPEDVLATLSDCMERAEFARFAPGADSQEKRKDLLDATADAITAVERSLERRS